jgi:hypothetical protein
MQIEILHKVFIDSNRLGIYEISYGFKSIACKVFLSQTLFLMLLLVKK